MLTRSRLVTAVWLAFGLAAGAASAEGPNLGRPIDAAEIAAWDISIQPDGNGFVPGGGGGAQITDIAAPMKRIANFWPYATTLFDYTRRSMPWQQPMTLANEEVYALTAYILGADKLIGAKD